MIEFRSVCDLGVRALLNNDRLDDGKQGNQPALNELRLLESAMSERFVHGILAERGQQLRKAR